MPTKGEEPENRATGKKPRRNWSEGASRREPGVSGGSGPPATVSQARPRVLGPCFKCAAWGHLAANCPTKDRGVYPFCQPVVSSAELSSDRLSDVIMVDNDQDVQTNTMSLYCLSSANVRTADLGVRPLAELCVNVLKRVWPENNKPYQDIFYDSETVSRPTNELGNQSFQTDQEALRFWETDEYSVQTLDVQGQLKKNLSFWKDVLHAPPPVLDCIEHGYRLPLKFLPPPYSQSNHKSAISHRVFVEDAVLNLLNNRCVAQVSEKPHVCSPLSVVSNSSGKLRLVLNLRYLNQFLHVVSFKYEDLRVAALMFEKDEFLFKFDLKSGYHHVDIYPEHQKYLGFKWDNNGNVNYYVFTVLPFGLSTACYLFTKLMRPLVRHWRGRGLKAIVYLDDGIVAINGERRAQEESILVRRELENAGFIINLEKSVWVPSQSMEWLGFNIDLCKGEFSVPSNKLYSLKLQLHAVAEAQSVPARQLASVIGKIMSMSLALGPVTRLMTRNLYFVLNQKIAWCQNLSLTLEASQELRFWIKEIVKFNGHQIWPKPSGSESGIFRCK